VRIEREVESRRVAEIENSRITVSLPQQHNDALTPDMVGQLHKKQNGSTRSVVADKRDIVTHLRQSLSTSGRVWIEVENESCERECHPVSSGSFFLSVKIW